MMHDQLLEKNDWVGGNFVEGQACVIHGGHGIFFTGHLNF